MSNLPFRLVAVCLATGSLAACAGTPATPPLQISQLGELGEAPPVQPGPAPRTHRFFANPFLHHAAYEKPTAVRLSSRSAIAEICAYAEGRAVLDRDLPGLTTRPEYPFFKHMSLQTLKGMSRGKMTDEDVAKVDADLARISPTQTASLP